MLTIIVCSINFENFTNLKSSIEESIGDIPFEIIRIENDILKTDITKAYNIGIKKAKYPFLLFIHEDVLFHTKKWGNILLNTFHEHPQVGIVGVAGSKIITKIPSPWWEHHHDHLVLNIIQHHPNGIIKNRNQGFCSGDLEEVAVIDGVFIAMKADARIGFNEKLHGFHNYDQSISLDYRKLDYKVIVINTILIEHFSSGNKNMDWVLSTNTFFKQYKSHLPQCIPPHTFDSKQLEILYFNFINSCKKVGNNQMAFHFWSKSFLRNPFRRHNLKGIIYFFKQYFSK